MKKVILITVLTLAIVMCSACGSKTNSVVQEGNSSEKVNAVQKENSSEEDDVTQEENLAELVTAVEEYYYVDSIGQAEHALIVKNNSSKTVTASVNVIAKDASGKTIGASTASVDAIPSGYEVCVENFIREVAAAEVFEYTMTVEETASYLKPLIQDLTFEQSLVGDKVIVTCTNKGKEDAKNVDVVALFFRDGEYVYYGTNWIQEIKAGATAVVEVQARESYEKEMTYDDAKVYLSGWR